MPIKDVLVLGMAIVATVYIIAMVIKVLYLRSFDYDDPQRIVATVVRISATNVSLRYGNRDYSLSIAELDPRKYYVGENINVWYYVGKKPGGKKYEYLSTIGPNNQP